MNASPSATRILFVITKANWGGAQRYVYDLAIAAKEKGMAVTVAFGTDGLLRTKLEAAGVRTTSLSTLTREVSFRDELETFHALRALIKEERPDIIHVNSSKAGLGLLAARLEKVPHIIFTAHGWAFNEKRPWWQKVLLRLIYLATVYLAHTTICVSDAVRRDLGFVPGKSLLVIQHGIDAPAFLPKEEARKKLFIGTVEGRWIGMTAELHPTKRVEDAIDAVAELSRGYPDLHLVVMGEGELKEWLIERVKHYGLEKRIHLPGFIIDAPEYLKAFDFFLMPSRTEALGLALVEAGYAGLPVVAARAGGIPEVVTHKKTGLLVPRENPHSLARAIRTLLEHPEDAALYGAALESSTRERFSRERMIKETFAVYGI
ncbi:MAG TPA: glycosyltransferase family 4 protein [Candidatus Paceibacterota bacterium]|nr:glycosyltransferase family 4 protein [Candidatus Paceibacterota bacterium]